MRVDGRGEVGTCGNVLLRPVSEYLRERARLAAAADLLLQRYEGLLAA